MTYPFGAYICVVVSDGYDTGPPDQLAREMAPLRRCARRIVWLTPMPGWRGYEPVARGMVAALPHRVREVIAVLGHDHTRVAAALAGLPVRIVVNDEYALGQMSSVWAGIAAIPDDPAAILVALADQPALEPADVDFLVDAFLTSPEPKIVVPVYRGQRGNPIVLPGMHLFRRCRRVASTSAAAT
jgi:CTP:molybdopterin cytidylyltransferase MocA